VTISRLWNHSVQVYRRLPAVEGRGFLTSTDKTAYPVGDAPSEHNARPDQTWGGALQDYGTGEQQGTMRRWFVAKDIDVRERDVLLVTAGDEAGQRLSVESVMKAADRTTLHHIEVNVKVWQGILAGDLES
jgi:hypothetical protein